MRDYIDKIVKNGNQEDMECLTTMFVDLMSEVKDSKPTLYKKYRTKLMGMAYNYKIDEELAHEIVEDMRPLGEYWDVETVKSVIGNDMHSLEEMYVVMNSLANDYKDVISVEEAETYVKMAHAWLDDVDGKEHKFWNYFVKE